MARPPQPADGLAAEKPWELAREELRRAKDRLEQAPEAGDPVGKEFTAAARKAYADGRAAYEAKDYKKAAELALAAEA